MPCVRLLEILPVLFERNFYPSGVKQSGYFKISESAFDFSWLHDLADWGKSMLKVVVVYWKRTVGSLLKLLKRSCNSVVQSTIKAIEDLISCGEYFIQLYPYSKTNLSFIFFPIILHNNHQHLLLTCRVF